MKKYTDYILKFFSGTEYIIGGLIVFKLLFQLIVIQSGLGWLTADDYSRTVISWDWLQDPRIYSGVWLSLHFWINGIFIWLIRDLFLGPVIANTLFSVLTLVFTVPSLRKNFRQKIAVISLSDLLCIPFPGMAEYFCNA